MLIMRFKHWQCKIVPGRYENNRLALKLVDMVDEEPIAKITVDVSEIPRIPGYIHVKDWDENEGMFQALMDAGIVQSEHVKIPSGSVDVIQAKLTDMALQEFGG